MQEGRYVHTCKSFVTAGQNYGTNVFVIFIFLQCVIQLDKEGA